jgi:hypothetical protein
MMYGLRGSRSEVRDRIANKIFGELYTLATNVVSWTVPLNGVRRLKAQMTRVILFMEQLENLFPFNDTFAGHQSVSWPFYASHRIGRKVRELKVHYIFARDIFKVAAGSTATGQMVGI